MDKDLEVTTHHFKTHISAIIRDLEGGKYDRVVLKRNKQPVAIFIRPDTMPGERRLGLMRGKMIFDKTEWDCLDDQIAQDFNSSDE